MNDYQEIFRALAKGGKIWLGDNKILLSQTERDKGQIIDKKTFFNLLAQGYIGITGQSPPMWVLGNVAKETQKARQSRQV